MSKRRDLEHLEQTRLIEFVRAINQNGWSFEPVTELDFMFAIPNGGQRNAIVAARIKAEGALSGVPDLFLPAGRRGYHGLFVELKVGKNRPTASQREMLEKLSGAGYMTAVAYGASNALAYILWYTGLRLTNTGRVKMAMFDFDVKLDKAGYALFPQEAK